MPESGDYPRPNDLSPDQLLSTAEQLLKQGDFGGARFYSAFGIEIGRALRESALVDGEYTLSYAERYLVRAYKVQRESINAMEAELRAKLDGCNGIKITKENLEVLLKEHSVHANRTLSLFDEYGLEYTIPSG